MKARIKAYFCYALAIFFIFAGIMHFVADDKFAVIVPPFLPFPYVIVWLTGGIEIVLAIGLLCPHFRKNTGLLFVPYLLAILPANIYMAIAEIPLSESLANPTALWIRVALQFPFIALILWAAGVFERKIK